MNIINNIHSNNINKYHIYPNRINNSYISNTDKDNKINENIEQNRNNIFNINIKISNRRNKQRKNYKFYEIHDNIKSNNNRNEIQTININRKEPNQKRCICSLGRNKLNDKRLFP